MVQSHLFLFSIEWDDIEYIIIRGLKTIQQQQPSIEATIIITDHTITHLTNT